MTKNIISYAIISDRVSSTKNVNGEPVYNIRYNASEANGVVNVRNYKGELPTTAVYFDTNWFDTRINLNYPDSGYSADKTDVIVTHPSGIHLSVGCLMMDILTKILPYSDIIGGITEQTFKVRVARYGGNFILEWDHADLMERLARLERNRTITA